MSAIAMPSWYPVGEEQEKQYDEMIKRRYSTNPNVELAKRYYEKHGYYLEGAPLPLWGEYNVATTLDDGSVVVTEITGGYTKTAEEIKEIPKAAGKTANKLFAGMAIILVLVIVAGIVT